MSESTKIYLLFYHNWLINLFGSVAQWLGCWSLAGRLSQPCTRSMVDRWPLCV